MKLSLYTFVKDGLRLDYHTTAMLRYHAKLFDEIVVAEGYSTDGTYEAIRDIDPKIRIIRSDLGSSLSNDWYVRGKDLARGECTGDWCVMVDSDEFLPEWEFVRLRQTLATTSETILPFRFLHFYGNYRVHLLTSNAPFGRRVHRNLPDMEVWGDGMNVRQRGVELTRPNLDGAFLCHHFGEVRRPARLREKWRAQGRRYHGVAKRDWLPSLAFDLLPHRWCRDSMLPRIRIYNGPYVSAVQEDPAEFVRDNFKVYYWAVKKGAQVDDSP
jgi:glycosyltransferase involved in cell wall biosynthesis